MPTGVLGGLVSMHTQVMPVAERVLDKRGQLRRRLPLKPGCWRAQHRPQDALRECSGHGASLRCSHCSLLMSLFSLILYTYLSLATCQMIPFAFISLIRDWPESLVQPSSPTDHVYLGWQLPWGGGQGMVLSSAWSETLAAWS